MEEPPVGADRTRTVVNAAEDNQRKKPEGKMSVAHKEENNVETKKKTLLTNSMRANYPKYSPDGRSILFVAHKNSTTQIYTMDIDGKNVKQITFNTEDTQVITPVWSPDGRSIAYAEAGPDGAMDIHILELSSGQSKQITNSEEADLFPIWHPDGSRISFTGLYELTPNLYTNDLFFEY